jgi:hypothetical protein
MARKQHTHHYIYKTTCNVTGRYYIGMHSTSNLEDGYIGSGRRLWLSINKHGKENHSVEILEWLPDRLSLKLREQELVNEILLKDEMCMNLQLGGGGGCTPEIQFKRSSAGGKSSWNKNRERHMDYVKKGGKITKERKHGLFSKNNPRTRGKITSDEHKKKIGIANSIKQKGEKNSQYGTCWITKDHVNKKIKRDEINQFLVEGWIRGRFSSQEFAEKMKICAKEAWENRKNKSH